MTFARHSIFFLSNWITKISKMRNHHLNDEPLVKKDQNRSRQLQIYKAYLKILLDIRFHKLGFYLMMIFSTIAIFLCLIIHTKPYYRIKDSNGHYEEFDYWEFYQHEFNDFKYYAKNVDNYILYPKTNLTHLLANYSEKSIIFDNKTAFEEYSKKENILSIIIDNKQKYFYNITSKIEISKGSRVRRYNFEDFADSFVNEITKELSDINRKFDFCGMTSFHRTIYNLSLIHI